MEAGNMKKYYQLSGNFVHFCPIISLLEIDV